MFKKVKCWFCRLQLKPRQSRKCYFFKYQLYIKQQEEQESKNKFHSLATSIYFILLQIKFKIVLSGATSVKQAKEEKK